jgi:hypothetical protein
MGITSQQLSELYALMASEAPATHHPAAPAAPATPPAAATPPHAAAAAHWTYTNQELWGGMGLAHVPRS